MTIIGISSAQIDVGLRMSKSFCHGRPNESGHERVPGQHLVGCDLGGRG